MMFLRSERYFRGYCFTQNWISTRPHLQKSHSNGGNKSHGQFQQKPCTLDMQNLKNGLKFFFHQWTSEKIPFLHFFLHKFWILQTLGHVTKKISYRHFHNASKECFWPKNFLNFMHGFKSAILAVFIMLQKNFFFVKPKGIQ